MTDLETPVHHAEHPSGEDGSTIWMPPVSNVLAPPRPPARALCDTLGLDLGGAGAPVAEDSRARRDRLRVAAIHGTPEQRVAFLLEEVFIQTTDVAHVVSAVEQLFNHARLLPNPGGLRVAAPAGMGKDALMRYLQRKYPPYQRGATYCCPLIHVDFRGYLAPKKVLMTLLRQLHAFYTDAQSLSDLEDNLLDAMQACENRLMVFNESQHLLPVSKSTRRHITRLAGAAGDWLKGFLDRAKRPAVFLGVTGWDAVFELDAQLGTRVPQRHEFGCFKFDAVFIGVLRQLDEAIPMPEPAGLGNDKELASDIFHSCRGNWRRLINLLAGAILNASRRGSPRIERADLNWAYFLLFGPHDNPFGLPGAP